MNMQQLKEFVSLEVRKRDLETDLNLARQQLDDLKEVLIPQFLEDGVQSMKVDGRSVSITREVRAAMVNGREEVVRALREAELDQYIGVNHQSFGAYVREVAREVEDLIVRENGSKPPEEQRLMTEEDVRTALPAPLAAAVQISFDHKLQSRKAAKA